MSGYTTIIDFGCIFLQNILLLYFGLSKLSICVCFHQQEAAYEKEEESEDSGVESGEESDDNVEVSMFSYYQFESHLNFFSFFFFFAVFLSATDQLVSRHGIL